MQFQLYSETEHIEDRPKMLMYDKANSGNFVHTDASSLNPTIQ
jgi:hypothetical protein